MPWVPAPAAPATNSPSAANSDHTYASRPWPNGCAASAGRRDHRLAMSRKISLPESAHECAASATSDADPVTAAAADFATAISTLAPKATSTVLRLSDAPGSRSRGTDPNNSKGLRPAPATADGAGGSVPPRPPAHPHD